MYNKFETILEVTPPAAAAKQVVTSVSDVNSGSADKTDPPLNPNHPSQRIKTPAAARGILWPGIALGLPSSPNLPIRAPRR